MQPDNFDSPYQFDDRYETHNDSGAKITKSIGVITTALPKRNKRSSAIVLDANASQSDHMKANYRHVAKIIKMIWSALGAPSVDFAEMVIIKNGFELPEWQTCLDEWLVDAVAAPVRESAEETKKKILNTIRKARKRLNDWQGIAGNPILIEHQLAAAETAAHEVSQYRYPALSDLLNNIIKECPIGCHDENIRSTIEFHLDEFLNLFDGTAKKEGKKRTHSSTSDYARATTLASKAYFKDVARPARGEAVALDEFSDAILAKFQADDVRKLIAILQQKLVPIEKQSAQIDPEFLDEETIIQGDICLTTFIGDKGVTDPLCANVTHFSPDFTQGPADAERELPSADEIAAFDTRHADAEAEPIDFAHVPLIRDVCNFSPADEQRTRSEDARTRSPFPQESDADLPDWKCPF
jgi:hypothetical protein